MFSDGPYRRSFIDITETEHFIIETLAENLFEVINGFCIRLYRNRNDLSDRINPYGNLIVCAYTFSQDLLKKGTGAFITRLI